MSGATDLLYDETDEELRGNLRGMLAGRSPWSKVLARIETPETCDTKLWAVLAGEMGLAGLAVPEELGGAGATWRQVAVVLEELGSAVAPVPYLGSAVIATRALLHCGERDLLAELAAGHRSAALAVPFSAMPPASATVEADGDALTGTVTSVADALIADVLLVPAGDALYAVAAADAARTPVVSLDMTRQLCDVAFDGASARRIASGPAAVGRGDGPTGSGPARLPAMRARRPPRYPRRESATTAAAASRCWPRSRRRWRRAARCRPPPRARAALPRRPGRWDR